MKIIKKITLPNMVKCIHEDDTISYELYDVDENGEEYISLDRDKWESK